MPPTLQSRRLQSSADIAALQSVLENTATFSLLTEGHLPSPTAAQEAMLARPPNLSADDKWMLGFYLDGNLIGCADICRGYPEAGTAFIGLLLFAEPFQGQGHGKTAMQHLRRLALTWHCQRIKISVIANNTAALAFWRREGFVERLRKPAIGFLDDAIVMECQLNLLQAAH
ncbi:MAG: GNAT family N-acetyltransferase [Proteobacteria bacterium]|nr:GNAT family N-acetyltransferase [Pseudomonadota bacterium]